MTFLIASIFCGLSITWLYGGIDFVHWEVLSQAEQQDTRNTFNECEPLADEHIHSSLSEIYFKLIINKLLPNTDQIDSPLADSPQAFLHC